MADPFENFIEPLRVVFSDPRTSEFLEKGEATGFYAALGAELSDFSAEALSEAAHRLKFAPRDKKEGRSFPPLETCVAACLRAQSDIAARKKRAEQAPRERLSPKEEIEREKFAIQQLGSALAERAALEGWICGFRDFCQAHGRHPNHPEIREIQQQRVALLRTLEKSCGETNLGGVYARRILKAIKERDRMLKEKVFATHAQAS